jgi:predicted methyltransferase
MEASRTRLTLDLSARLTRSVERITEQQGISKADVFRNALALLFAFDDAAKDGFAVGAFDSRQGIYREFVGRGVPHRDEHVIASVA